MLDKVEFGGGTKINLRVPTTPNANVRLANEKYNKTIQADSNGLAIFKGVPIGTYTLTSSLGGASISDSVVISNEVSKYLPIGKMLKDMPLGTKVKTINGVKWVLQAKNHADYQDGALTMICEYWYDKRLAFNSTLNSYYRSSIVRDYLINEFYNSLTDFEKSKIMITDVKCRHYQGGKPIEDYVLKDPIFLPSASNIFDYEDGEGTNIGFTTDDSRIFKNGYNGSPRIYWTRTEERTTGYMNIVVENNGTRNSGNATNVYEVRPMMNLLDDTIVTLEPDKEGYHRILHPSFMIKDLPIGTKIKMGTFKWKIVDKNHEGFPENSVSLFSTHSMVTSIYNSNNSSAYKGSSIEYKLNTDLFANFSEKEKSAMLKTNFEQYFPTGNEQLENYLFPPSLTELNLDTKNEGTKLQGITSNQDRVVYIDDNGGAGAYWTRSMNNNSSVYVISNTGTTTSADPSKGLNVAAILNIKQDAIFEYDINDDYWKLK